MKLHNAARAYQTVLIACLFVSGCESSAPPAQSEPPDEAASPGAPGPTPQPPANLEIPSATATPSVSAPPEPWSGPFFAVTRSSTGIYAEPSFERGQKIGYAGEGAQVNVHPDPVVRDNCKAGWYRVVEGGYVCGKHGTTKLDDERVRNGPKQPDLNAILPYMYARNAHNGTPLYRSVPSPAQVRIYEPYLDQSGTAKTDKTKSTPPDPEGADKAVKSTTAPVSAEDDDATRRAREDQQRRMQALRAARRAMLGEEAARKLEQQEDLERKQAEPEAPPVPDAGAAKEWWQKDDVELHRIKLEDLNVDGDDVIAKRMVKGFYIAVDRTFNWNKRRWYRSTSGAIAPAERFHTTTGSDFKGVELDDTWKLPIGWAYGWNKTKPRYTVDVEAGKAKPDGTVKRFEALNLTGKELELGKTTYLETVGGFWVRKRDVRVTRPGPPPAGVGPDERWLDINLAAQSVVLFRGATPLYATLISSGKEHKDKAKDHKTPLGEFRVREKHVTATMDGDGTAAGDLPYSIEAVPYVMYFEGSYALHGAFWHQNYGVRMSHGCVNLAPLDAKYLFFNSDPPVPPGWHGAWASEDQQGSLVVVHE
jgi:hypothetical protein